MEVGKGKATHVQRSLQYEARKRRKAEAEAVQVLVERSARLRCGRHEQHILGHARWTACTSCCRLPCNHARACS